MNVTSVFECYMDYYSDKQVLLYLQYKGERKY